MISDPNGEKTGVLSTNRLTVGTSREGIAEIYRACSDSLSSEEIQ
ncbi:MAG: hypothetical protein WAO31_06540 [Rhodoluna sp.]